MERFFNKIAKTDSCWNWIGCLRGKSGYGAFKVNGKTIDAHRFSYILHIGDIPDNMYVCHRCDNRKCVNPEHLFLGTAKDNWSDGFKKGRIKLMGGINTELMKKHPGRGAYLRGCRCKECLKLRAEKTRIYRKSKIK